MFLKKRLILLCARITTMSDSYSNVGELLICARVTPMCESFYFERDLVLCARARPLCDSTAFLFRKLASPFLRYLRSATDQN